MPLTVLEHALATHTLTQLRDETTPFTDFRRLTRTITHLLIAEATRDIPLSPKTVQTPLEAHEGGELGCPVVAIPILRAGLGMLDATLELIPEARVGYIGLERDEETAVAKTYYCKLPPLQGAEALLLDPMLATGGSAEWAIRQIADQGAARITLVSVVATPEGVLRLAESFPHVRVVTAALDRGMNSRKYIVPGLGDFGDRLFGTQ